jgi:2-methylcitrate dehydratase PrpD
VQFKRHASCFFTHPVIEALVALAAEHGIRGEDVGRVEVGVAPSVLAICDRADPGDGLEAKFSFQATAAYALLGIDTGDPTVYAGQIHRPAVRRLIEKVTATGEADLGPAQSRVAIERTDGVTVATAYDLEDPPADAPELRGPLEHKFELLTDGRAALSPRRLIELIDGLEALEDVNLLTTALRAPDSG